MNQDLPLNQTHSDANQEEDLDPDQFKQLLQQLNQQSFDQEEQDYLQQMQETDLATQILIKQQMQIEQQQDDNDYCQEIKQSKQKMAINSKRDLSKNRMSSVKIKESRKIIMRSFSQSNNERPELAPLTQESI